MTSQPGIPLATYRLQFNSDFTFNDAERLIPYLNKLGISHCYASPYLKARAGSHHGYDIVDHNTLNPEIGSEEDYDRFVSALRMHEMGQVLDIVPNHMGVGGDDNIWWLDVLENGQASIYADFFDIDWCPVKDELRGKVLIASLGDHYGNVLENGDLHLVFDAAGGVFSVYYYHHRFPIDPKTYSIILNKCLEESDIELDNDSAMELKALSNSFEELPATWTTDLDSVEERNRLKELYKHRLAELCKRVPAAEASMRRIVKTLNGIQGDPSSFEQLHQLLEKQAYRLAYWQVASHEINYRRFFDINELAGLRMENQEVFRVTHEKILKLVAQDKIQGLRIDHPDGLHNPKQYYQNLQQYITAVRDNNASSNHEHESRHLFYVVVEKILASHEHLPEDWPVYGTTGYEFANLVNGLFIYAPSANAMDRIYRRFIRTSMNFDDLVYERKKQIMDTALSSELNVLANMLDRISESDPYTRDYTLIGLREALREVVACFPVYRTYVTEQGCTPDDVRYVDWAVAQAKKRGPASDPSIFNFIRDVLLLEWLKDNEYPPRSVVAAFAMKFQQYTAPVMAKGVEDTCFYIYNRLVSLNEVGGDPRRFGTSISAFHHLNQDRVRYWPQAMLNTSTHDTKRSEDVRTRINVLTEMHDLWQPALVRWSRYNRRHKPRIDADLAPSRNDEYLLYQTLIGAWPLKELNEQELGQFKNRIQDYMLKAIREAKVHTSWINPNSEYETAMKHFVDALLGNLQGNRFLDDFVPFQSRIAVFGMWNSLSQVILKLTSPGVPDIYQGNELWDLSLVDPDNRRPVDYEQRRAMLEELSVFDSLPGQELKEHVKQLQMNMQDGRIKLYVTWRMLNFRKHYKELFQTGEYVPLHVDGAEADHCCAYLRRDSENTVLIVVSRWLYTLTKGQAETPINPGLWGDTSVVLPSSNTGEEFQDIFTGNNVVTKAKDEAHAIFAQDLFTDLPFAVLLHRA